MVNLKVCHSELVDTEYALKEIMSQSIELDKSKVKGIIAFADVDFDLDRIRKKLCKDFPSAQIIGGTSYGEMSSILGWKEDSLLVGFFYGEEFDIETISIDNIAKSLDKKLVEPFNNSQKLKKAKLCILLSDAFSLGGENVIRSLREFIPPNIPIVGGMAADQWTFTGTKQFSNKGVYTSGLVAMFISGDFNVGISTATGWEPKGKKAIVNRSEGNIVYEIDHMPALDFYEKSLGTKDGTFGEYPLAICRDDKVAYFRAALKWDVNDGSMIFAGSVPTGSQISVSTTTRELILKATTDSTQQACEDLSGKASWAMVVSCAARRQLLGTQAGSEIKNTMKVMGDTPVLGFNCYGEYLDVKSKYPDSPGFLNESFCVVTIGQE